jgi:hypothetical protein
MEFGDVNDFGTDGNREHDSDIIIYNNIGVDDETFAKNGASQKNKPLDGLQKYSISEDRYFPCGPTKDVLTSGVYDILKCDAGIYYQSHVIHSDVWLNFRNDLITKVLSEIETFWKSGEKFKKYGFLQRRGYMFYGPPGCGKSVLFKQIIERIVKSDGVVFYCGYPELLVDGLKLFRKIEPDRRVVVIFEDVDALIVRYGDSALLSYLDGEDSSDNILNLFSTNYPERLDKRLVNRPCRIDRLIPIGYPDEQMREYYFSEKLGIEKDELSQWVSLTKNFPFAALTELVISVKCLGNSLEESAAILRKLTTSKLDSDSFFEKKAVGFGACSGG